MTSSQPPDTQRMEALAQVAGGIAPALSDLLTVIRGQTGVLLDTAEHDAGASEALKQIYTAAEKAGTLLRQLLIFSRQQTPHTVAVDLNHLIEHESGVLRRVLGDTISVEFRLAPSLPLIVADPGMLEEVLLILALNARDAMPAGGTLKVTTALGESPGAAANPVAPAEDRCYAQPQPGEAPERLRERSVVLTVADNGAGIAPEILPHIWEPFFTTKAGGRSVGLGLATVFGIVRQHGGWITVESAVEAGTSFNVFLPVAPGEAVADPDRKAGGGARSGHETILLVEDDAAVREFTVAVLREQGYRVLQAVSGKDALEVWQWHGPRVRLLLTDMVLEDHMSGLELAAKLRAENPTLKVICTSGHRRNTMERFPSLSGSYRFLPKPCRPQTLLATMRTLLDENTP